MNLTTVSYQLQVVLWGLHFPSSCIRLTRHPPSLSFTIDVQVILHPFVLKQVRPKRSMYCKHLGAVVIQIPVLTPHPFFDIRNQFLDHCFFSIHDVPQGTRETFWYIFLGSTSKQ